MTAYILALAEYWDWRGRYGGVDVLWKSAGEGPLFALVRGWNRINDPLLSIPSFPRTMQKETMWFDSRSISHAFKWVTKSRNEGDMELVPQEVSGERKGLKAPIELEKEESGRRRRRIGAEG
jgi:hypothetical protein